MLTCCKERQEDDLNVASTVTIYLTVRGRQSGSMLRRPFATLNSLFSLFFLALPCSCPLYPNQIHSTWLAHTVVALNVRVREDETWVTFQGSCAAREVMCHAGHAGWVQPPESQLR